MTLNLLKRAEKGAQLSQAEHDANFTAIEDAVNLKAEADHSHSVFGVAGLNDTLTSLATALGNKAEVGHNHQIHEVVGLGSQMNLLMLMVENASIANNVDSIKDIVGEMFVAAGGSYDAGSRLLGFPSGSITGTELASLSSSFAASFKTAAHEAPLGIVPLFFDWASTGRVYSTDYAVSQNHTTHKHIVPWMHAFGNDTNVWPTDIGVEVGVHEMWGKLISTGQWAFIRSWPTLNAYKHNRDDHGYNNGNGVAENAFTAPTGTNTKRTTADGTWVVRRDNSATFPSIGTNIHGFFLEADASHRPYLDRTLYSKVAIRGKYRTVGWPSADGLAPILSPASNATGDKVVIGLGADCYLDAQGAYNTSYGGDLGILAYKLAKNDWRWLHWYTCTAAAFAADPPPYITA